MITLGQTKIKKMQEIEAHLKGSKEIDLQLLAIERPKSSNFLMKNPLKFMVKMTDFDGFQLGNTGRTLDLFDELLTGLILMNHF